MSTTPPLISQTHRMSNKIARCLILWVILAQQGTSHRGPQISDAGVLIDREAISGITLPRASERMSSASPEPWRCVVSLRMVTDENGVELGRPCRVTFDGPIFGIPLSQTGFPELSAQSSIRLPQILGFRSLY